jgi:hypothetical protein
MAYIITGLFSDQTTGLAVEAALLKRGFDADDVRVVAGPGDEAVLASLVGKGLTQAEAGSFAAAVRNGGSVVSVTAGFGYANPATHEMKKHRPVALRNAKTDDGGDVSHNPAPFSEMFGWSVLSHGAAPFSAFFGLNPSVKSRPLNIKILDNPSKTKLIDKPSKTKLIRNPAPLSSMFKLPTLTRGR